MALQFDLNQILFEQEDFSFFKIGKEATSNALQARDFKNSKYKKINQIWGTLGWANDKPLVTSGKIKFSENGNIDHKGVTKETVELLKEQNVEIEEFSDIRERFIDLSEINFQNIPDNISSEEEVQLRFDLFVEKNEGALVYLEENPMDNYHSEDAEMYLITPESTDKDCSQNRYCLSYRFTFTFNKKFEIIDNRLCLIDKNKDQLTQFALKILTFPRTESDIKKYTEKSSKCLNNLSDLGVDLAHRGLNKLGIQKYRLYKYSFSNNNGAFLEVNESNPIDFSEKTLLLIHGTFSSVNGSFGELLESQESVNNNQNLFQQLIATGTFDQIIAFNHPTASHSVKDNVDYLLKLFNKGVFKYPVDIITTSRGALIAEKLSSYNKAYGTIKINKLLTFAPAHGSHLLNTAKGLDSFLSLLKRNTSKTAWGYILGIAQFSVNAIRTQPGLEVMMPESKKLQKILSANPINEIQIKSMVGAYDSALIDRRLIRWFANGLDKLLWLYFRSDNDWVIGCREQRKQMAGSNAKYDKNFEYFCIHGKQFDPNHPLKNGQKAEVRKVIFEYFGLRPARKSQ